MIDDELSADDDARGRLGGDDIHPERPIDHIHRTNHLVYTVDVGNKTRNMPPVPDQISLGEAHDNRERFFLERALDKMTTLMFHVEGRPDAEYQNLNRLMEHWEEEQAIVGTPEQWEEEKQSRLRMVIDINSAHEFIRDAITRLRGTSTAATETFKNSARDVDDALEANDRLRDDALAYVDARFRRSPPDNMITSEGPDRDLALKKAHDALREELKRAEKDQKFIERVLYRGCPIPAVD